MEFLHDYYLALIRKKRIGPLPSLLRGTLLILSWLFGSVVMCRNCAYDHGLFSRHRPRIPVISIGNITAGGSGKTPLTLLLAQAFYPNVPLAILSRGYRSPAEKLDHPLMLSKGFGPLYPAAYCGDEPYLLAKNLPKAWIIVGRDRKTASEMAAEAGAEIIFLDDGMQRRSLARDLEVVVMNAGDPFGLGHFLPRGLLREGLHSLNRADIIVINQTQDHADFISLEQKIKAYTSAPVVGTRIEIISVWNGDRNIKDMIKNKKAGIFCGIAHPEQFEKTVKELGIIPIMRRFLPDHKGFDHEGLQRFATECQDAGAEWLICTEKDFVKLSQIENMPLPIVWLQMKLRITEGEQLWKDFLASAKNLVSR